MATAKKATATATQQKPQLPSWLQGNLDQYKMQQATTQDLANRYGFDYSQAYANRIAEAEAQAKRSGLQYQLDQLDNNLKAFQQGLDQDYFLKYMNQAQAQTNAGINSGIAADQNLRLAMNRQNQLAQYMNQNQLQRDQIQAALASLPLEQRQRAEQIYQERLQQAFQNATKLDELRSDYAKFMANLDLERYKWNNLSAEQRAQQQLAYAQLEWEKQRFGSEQKWREYTYNHMSAAERAQLDANIRQFGEELAWRMEEARMINEREYYAIDAQAGLKAGLGGYDASAFLDW